MAREAQVRHELDRAGPGIGRNALVARENRVCEGLLECDDVIALLGRGAARPLVVALEYAGIGEPDRQKGRRVARLCDRDCAVVGRIRERCIDTRWYLARSRAPPQVEWHYEKQDPERERPNRLRAR